MVKNTKGGSGHKGMARKNVVGPRLNTKTRLSQDENEIYAQVIATLGNGMCHVMCMDNKKRLCFIRGKFRGRGKRDNIINNGKWVLVGNRDFETEKSGIGKDLDKCDLLEVYTDTDKLQLQSYERKMDWGKFILVDNNIAGSDDTGEIEFSNIGEDEYKQLMEQELKSPSNKISLEEKEKESVKLGEEDDEIEFGDI